MRYRWVTVIGALALCSAAARAYACDLPSIPLIPAQSEVGERLDQVRAEASVYFSGMRAYSACVQAELKAAGGDAAAGVVKAMLVARNNAAVAEAQAVQKLFEERIGGGLTPKPGTEA